MLIGGESRAHASPDLLLCQASAERPIGPPFVVAEDAAWPCMTHERGIHVDRSMPFLDRPVVESLMIPLEAIVLDRFLHGAAEWGANSSLKADP